LEAFSSRTQAFLSEFVSTLEKFTAIERVEHYHWGFDLPMSIGAIAMSLSTIIVAANAQLLRRLKLQRATH
jgi:hypothetical protein